MPEQLQFRILSVTVAGVQTYTVGEAYAGSPRVIQINATQNGEVVILFEDCTFENYNKEPFKLTGTYVKL